MAMSRTAEKTRAKAEEALSELEMRQRIDDLKQELASINRTLAALGGQKAEDYRESVERLASDASPLVRAMAVWAASRLCEEEAFHRLCERLLPLETDPAVQAEWSGSESVKPAA